MLRVSLRVSWLRALRRLRCWVAQLTTRLGLHVRRLQSRSLPIVLLTREEHADGSWLTDLHVALESRGAVVRVITLAEFTGVGQWRCLVNRVSDAAPPADVKVALAALRACELHRVPVINGTSAYALGTSKMLHYELFTRARLVTPPYVVVRRSDVSALVQLATEAKLRYPLLLKPNSAGFGDGIVRIESADELRALGDACIERAFSGDGIALLQEYVAPAGGRTFRVWFVDGRVHCAVSVQPQSFSFNACVRAVPNQPWDVPPAIAAMVVKLAALAQADCGSVEFLFGRHEGAAAAEQGPTPSPPPPLFFDFNLLSTLPSAAQYAGLAAAIEGKC